MENSSNSNMGDLSSQEQSLFSFGAVTNAEGQDTTQLTNIELIKKAEEFTENLELEKAVALYDEGLIRFPNDTIILDSYTDLLL